MELNLDVFAKVTFENYQLHKFIFVIFIFSHNATESLLL